MERELYVFMQPYANKVSYNEISGRKEKGNGV